MPKISFFNAVALQMASCSSPLFVWILMQESYAYKKGEIKKVFQWRGVCSHCICLRNGRSASRQSPVYKTSEIPLLGQLP
jgi:hypothetical protein